MSLAFIFHFFSSFLRSLSFLLSLNISFLSVPLFLFFLYYFSLLFFPFPLFVLFSPSLSFLFSHPSFIFPSLFFHSFVFICHNITQIFSAIFNLWPQFMFSDVTHYLSATALESVSYAEDLFFFCFIFVDFFL